MRSVRRVLGVLGLTMWWAVGCGGSESDGLYGGGSGTGGSAGGSTCQAGVDCSGCSGCFALCQCGGTDPSTCLAQCADAGAPGGAGGASGTGGAPPTGGASGGGALGGAAGTGGGGGTSGVGATGGTGATGGGGPTCGGQPCPPATGGFLPGCCAASDQCGYDLTSFGAPGCVEKNQPGVQSSACPALDTGQGFVLPGCCRPNGVCGFLDQFLGLGCVDPTQFGAPPESC
ncbi:MAG: hypothetical protein IT376_09810 [Polyangiaceae bacterium]|nr:hypothetical protein [Polyangiaceae bacterium]